MSDLAFETVVNGDQRIIRAHGRLIADQAILLRDHVKPQIREAKRITLDLSDVTYMDSMGLGTIASLYVSARTAGCQFEVMNLTQRVRDLFSVTHLLGLFEAAGSSSVIIP
jgi:anti-sigma B factor antagonist